MNTIGWGQALKTNNIYWGRAAVNSNGFGYIYQFTYKGQTKIG